MTDKEKIGWLAWAILLGFAPMATFVLMTLTPGPNAARGQFVAATLAVSFAAVYLFALLLRGVYLAGKRKR